MKQIGITGGMGSGKSWITKVFAQWRVPVYDADSRAKYVMQHDALLQTQLKEYFGEAVFDAQGNLQRAYLANMVFKDEAALQRLNSCVHPAVQRDYEGWAAMQRKLRVPYILKEAALLVESGTYRYLDALMVVTAPLDLRIARVLRRDPALSQADVEARIARQSSDAEKIAHAQAVLVNDESTLLLPTIVELHRQYSQ